MARTNEEITQRIIEDLKVYTHPSMRTIEKVAGRIGGTKDDVIIAAIRSDRIVVREDANLVSLL